MYYEESEYEIYLPKFESFKRTLIRNYGSLWNLTKFDYPHCRFDVYWKICHRVIESNIGKAFDMAFHYYCTKVPKQYQYLFLKEFEKEEKYWRYRKYDVDENKNIILKPKKSSDFKKPSRIYTSLDFKVDLKSKVTGLPVGSWYFPYIQNLEDYEIKVLQGTYIVFDTSNHSKLIRLNKIKAKAYKRHIKQKAAFDEEKFRMLLRERGKKEKEENKIKIEAHGFSPELSFRKHDIR